MPIGRYALAWHTNDRPSMQVICFCIYHSQMQMVDNCRKLLNRCCSHITIFTQTTFSVMAGWLHQQIDNPSLVADVNNDDDDQEGSAIKCSNSNTKRSGWPWPPNHGVLHTRNTPLCPPHTHMHATPHMHHIRFGDSLFSMCVCVCVCADIGANYQ